MQNLISKTDIENEILRAAYDALFLSDGSISLAEIRKNTAVSEIEFEKVVDWMKVNGLIQPRALGGIYEIRASGIVEAEKRGIVSEELAIKNKQARASILSSLIEAYHEHGPDGRMHYEQMAKKHQLDHETVLNNLDVLTDEYFYAEEDSASGFYKLTYHGLAFSERCKQMSNVIDQFEQLSKLQPQARGRAFQKFFAQLLAQDDWIQHEGVRTAHEEMDIIISRDREYYLVECKWEKEVTEANVIRELMGKLTNRIDVRGIAVSMSGFSQGAVDQTGQFMNNRVIVLFGPEDVRSIVHGQAKFTDLLNEKYREAVTRRNIIFS